MNSQLKNCSVLSPPSLCPFPILCHNSTSIKHPHLAAACPTHRHLFTDCSTWDDPHTTGPRGFYTNGQGPCPMRQTLNAFAMRTPEGYKALQEYRALSARSEEARSLKGVMEVAAAGACAAASFVDKQFSYWWDGCAFIISILCICPSEGSGRCKVPGAEKLQLSCCRSHNLLHQHLHACHSLHGL